MFQQNTAQQSRQNNHCSNRTDVGLSLTDSRFKSLCIDKDASRNKHTRVKGGGAKAKAGAATVTDLFAQTTAQEGRQNNNCAVNHETDLEITRGETDNRCANKDRSKNHKTVVKSGAAKAKGGDGLAGVVEQNTAQAGRQNNDCANGNGGDVLQTDSRKRVTCKTLDASKNVRTKEKRGAVKAKGEDGTSTLFQQNTAQTGRQSNSCDNDNRTPVIASALAAPPGAWRSTAPRTSAPRTGNPSAAQDSLRDDPQPISGWGSSACGVGHRRAGAGPGPASAPQRSKVTASVRKPSSAGPAGSIRTTKSGRALSDGSPSAPTLPGSSSQAMRWTTTR